MASLHEAAGVISIRRNIAVTVAEVESGLVEALFSWSKSLTF
jgi:hypothetical protein